MKKLAFVLALCLVCGSVCACGDNSGDGSGSVSDSDGEDASGKTVSERTKALLDDVTFPSMVEVTSDNLSIYYKIDSEKVTEFSAYLCGSSAMPDEFGIFVAASEEDADDIKSALDERIEKQRETYTDYSPDEMYKFDDCFVTKNGSEVYYAVCADNAKASELLK